MSVTFFSVLLACPTCAASQESASIWVVLLPFLLVPFVVSGFVWWLLRDSLSGSGVEAHRTKANNS